LFKKKISENYSGGDKKEVNKFPCGVKHNFDSGVIIESDDRKKYEWNCSTCELKDMTISKDYLKDFKTSGKVGCPLLTYE
jgi:hypothetical protein